MEYKSENIFTIKFHDGTLHKSNGEADSIRKIKIRDEMDWIGMQIAGQLSNLKRTMSDVATINIQINFKLKE
jgi:hypothetical protein